MKKQNIFVKLLSLILCITLLSPTVIQAATLSTAESISGHWAEETLTYWDMLGLFEEIPDDEFGVDKAISRGAFVYILNTMLGIEQTENTAHNFTDISENDWNYEDIITAYNIGYISGYPDNTFRADSPITREEMCTIISRYFGLDKAYDDSKLQNFTDKDKIQSYALYHIGALAELETVNGYPNGSFKPQNNITYAEAVTIITRFLGYINGGSGVSGRIYYESKPVYNAEITVYNHNTNEIAVQGTSDVYGDYILDTSAGMYDIVVTKNETVAMISGVEVGEDTRTYNKIILEAGQYVTGVLADENAEPLAETKFYIKGDTYVTVVTDENGVFTVILPVDGDYVILAEVNDKLTEIAEFQTSETENGLDLGTVVVSTGEKTAKTEGTTIKPPLWYLNSMIQDAINKDENDTEEDDTEEDDNDKTDEEETPEFDYSSLPYREPKTMAELVELNGGEMPKLYLNDDNTIGLYVGNISENKIENVYDIITELNNIADIFNLYDARFEFIPYNNSDGVVKSGQYKLQQVYNGVPVMASYVTCTIDNGYITSIKNGYRGDVKYLSVCSKDIITDEIAISCVEKHIAHKYNDNYIPKISSCYLVINNENNLVYYITDAFGFYMVDAINGDIVSSEEILPQTLVPTIYTSESELITFTDEYNASKNIKEEIVLAISNDNAENKYGYFDMNKEISIYNKDGGALLNNNVVEFNGRSFIGNPGEFVTTNSPTANTYLEQASGYAMLNMQRCYDVYENIVNLSSIDGSGIPISISVNINSENSNDIYQNAFFWVIGDIDNNGIDEAIFGFGDTLEGNTQYPYTIPLDVVGHEYTHGVQYCAVTDIYNKERGFGGGFTWNVGEEPNSRNLAWVEAMGLSEGTADVMGMLIEAIVFDKNLKTDEDFYLMRESTQTLRNHNNTTSVCSNTEHIHTNVRDIYSCYTSANQRDNLIYGRGPGHNEAYICPNILHAMIFAGNGKQLDDAEQLFKLWYGAITLLDSQAGYSDLYYALIQSALDLSFTDEEIVAIEWACNHAGIETVSIGKNVTSYPWYYKSMKQLEVLGILEDFTENDMTVSPSQKVSQQEFIELIINVCNNTGANITVFYDNGVATLTKPIFGESSHESMSLMFDESKDILRWEAFIIAYRILNFCHAEFKDKGWISLYNYSYEDKKAGTAEYEKFMSENQLIFDGFYTNNNYEEILEKYYGSMSYEDFHNSYMYVRNNTSDWQTSKYDFGESDTMTETHHIITTVIYNIYRSLGRDFNMITLAPDLSDVVFNEKMTLAHACYLLYSFIK